MGFTIQHHAGYTRLTVKNPWENARNVEVEYHLFRKGAPVPDSLSGKNILRIPAEKVICLSTSHLSYLEAWGKLTR